ncbi:putative extracellular soluble lytic transglycosylase [Macrophomina phaseolina]|uniref:Extracellular soluble lytic transglycosylase n=1 Tax=Macrophomina phaseolina TaxID=35725 RepID=A0ABQ8G9G3_9PEZI|nr:putative extracellular soluble lytic transglycosylase [Macrophomina phaseolina]
MTTQPTIKIAYSGTLSGAHPGSSSHQRAVIGPNASEEWFNTGLATANGWEPPFLNFTALYHISRAQFYAGAGRACAQYDDCFQRTGDGHGIDPAILAFIATQESSCNAPTGGQTPGLMQVSCANYPGGQCTNSLEDDQLNVAGNNALLAIGSGLNGDRGVIEEYPCSDEGTANGLPQNLDYLQEMLNRCDQYYIETYNCKGQCGNENKCQKGQDEEAISLTG